MNRTRALIEDCCGWNRRTWADAVEFAVAGLPEDLRGYRVLEIGASDRSALAPLFVARGAEVVCSYYRKSRDVIANGSLRRVCARYGLGMPKLSEMDIAHIDGIYDIIVMKSVLGGVCRDDDYEKLGTTVHRLAESLPGRGVIISLDDGHIKVFKRLRTLLGTGGSMWTYVRTNKLAESLGDLGMKTAGFGFFNRASVSLRLGIDCKSLNAWMHAVDKLVLRLFEPAERAVFSTVIRAAPAAGP